jgi:hypothetical protein
LTHLSRDRLLAVLTTLAEKDYDSALLGGTVHLIEPTALQRLEATRAAFAENPDVADDFLYRAILIQQCTVDPETKEPLLTPEDAALLATSGREKAVEALAIEIMRLGQATADDLFRGHNPTDAG